MAIAIFLLFIAFNHLIISGIFRLSNQYNTLWRNYLLIALWGVAAAYLFFAFVAPGFFIYFLVIAPILLAAKGFRTFRAARIHMAENIESFSELSQSERIMIAAGLQIAKREFIINSIIFLIFFSVSYIYFFNL